MGAVLLLNGLRATKRLKGRAGRNKMSRKSPLRPMSPARYDYFAYGLDGMRGNQ
jgi:hypothetical protein